MVRILWWRSVAVLSVALGMIGVIIPGLPTVPFLLVAAWAGTRGSGLAPPCLESLGPAPPNLNLTLWPQVHCVSPQQNSDRQPDATHFLRPQISRCK